MTKPGSLLAQLKRTTQQAGNVVRFERATDPDTLTEKAEPAPLAKPAPDGGGDDYAELLAPLDALLSGHEVRAAQAALAEVTTSTALVPTAPPRAVLTVPQFFNVASQGIDFANTLYFFATVGGQYSLWRVGFDYETGFKTFTPVSMASAQMELAPYKVNVATPNGTKSVSLFTLWAQDPRRTAYPGGVVLLPEGNTPPGCFNRWQGYGVVPRAGNAAPMLDHISMLCGGHKAITDYVLNWLAFCVQRPWIRPEVALVLRGGRGTGKGTVFRIMLRIFASHGLHLTQPKHFTGAFNAHLHHALFVFVDEAYLANDKAAEGVLKGLITEGTLMIESKHVNAFSAINRLKVGMASNSSWVVPAGADERRFMVVDVSSAQAQNHAYFAALNAFIDGDGAATFLDHLLSRDLSGFNVRSVPATAALDMQKIEGMTALDRWILEALDTGTGMCGDEWTDDPHRVVCDVAATRFDHYCKRSAARGTRADTRTIGRRFGEVFGCGPATVGRVGSQQRGRAWTLPGITQARAKAASVFGLAQYEWGAV